MGPIKKTILEAVILVIVGGAIASAANSLRSEHSLYWNKNYFRKVVIPKPVATKVEGNSSSNDARPDGVGHMDGDKDGVTGSANAASTVTINKPDQADDVKKLDHGFQEASFDDVLAGYNDPDKAMGLIVFVDARADEPYEEGHIPGALQIDHYQLDRYLDDAMQFIPAADKVFVYCNGGTCEDSIFVCTDLFEYGIDPERIYLYEGGWKEWSSKKNAPIEKGPRRY